MSEIPRESEEPLSESEMVGTVEKFFAQQSKVADLLRQFNEQEKFAQANDGRIVKVFHRVYVVGEVEQPVNKRWWSIFPVEPINLKTERLPEVLIELLTKLREYGVDYIRVADEVSSLHLNNIVPKIGDIIHIRRENDRNGSIINPVDVIKDNE